MSQKVSNEAKEKVEYFRQIVKLLENAIEDPNILYLPNFLKNDNISEAVIDTINDLSSPYSWKVAAEGYQKRLDEYIEEHKN